MKRLKSKERKMIKFIEKNVSVSEETLKDKFGEKYLETLSSLLNNGVIERKNAYNQPYYDQDLPSNCFYQSEPKGNYELADNSDNVVKKIPFKKILTSVPIISNAINAIIGVLSAILKFLQLFH